MRLIAALLMGLLLMWASPFSPAPAMAQTAGEAQPEAPPKVVIDKKKLLVQPRNAEKVGFWEDPVLWMRDTQQAFYGQMNMSLRQLRATSSGTAAWTLFVMSFLYGVFHAAGPGHGKAVISGWLLATESELKRGILIAFMSAMIQALTAIVIVSALLLFVSGAAQMARNAAGLLESASYLMIAGMGLYLIWTGWRSAIAPKQAAATSANGVVERRHDAMTFDLVSRPQSLHPDPHHIHDENCGCGHAHMPDAAELKGEWSLRRAFALAFAVGIRPCSGAILVLVFSYPLGLYSAGVASVLAMGIGVFLTISAIAALTVYAKSWAFALAGADNPILGLAVKWGKTVVGLAIMALGGLLFLGSLGGPNMMT